MATTIVLADGKSVEMITGYASDLNAEEFILCTKKARQYWKVTGRVRSLGRVERAPAMHVMVEVETGKVICVGGFHLSREFGLFDPDDEFLRGEMAFW
ncbi:MAG: hypothetical protein WC551_07775 [Patescibacteria group bacterium]